MSSSNSLVFHTDIQESINRNMKDTIDIIMYLHPLVYSNSAIIRVSQNYEGEFDVPPSSRSLNGSWTDYCGDLEPPIIEPYNTFVSDCSWFIKQTDLTITEQESYHDQCKAEYRCSFSWKDTPCGHLVYTMRVSDDPFVDDFPEKYKEDVRRFLVMNKVLDGSAHHEDIDFSIERVLVDGVDYDSWADALWRVGKILDRFERRAVIHSDRNSSSKEA